jgi:hypothetical protein
LAVALQIPSDNSGNYTQTYVDPAGPGGVTVTQTYTIPKLTAAGAAGSAVITNGVVTAYTPPT